MRARNRGRLAFVAGALAALACGDLDPFQCVGDAQCRRGSETGTCTVVGYCAYPDDACPSGMRFSPEAAQAIAGECTEPQLPGTGDSGLDDSASSPEGSSGSSDGGESTAESTGGGPLPSCGDGEVQDGEECDDGNDVRADACNPDCRLPGKRISAFVSQHVGADVAWDMLLWEGDIVIVGQAAVPDEGLDLFAARYGPDGTAAWEQTWSGSAHGNDRLYAVTRSPGGALLAGGYVVPSANNVTPRPQFWIGELDPDTGASLWDDRDGEPPPSSDQVWDLLAPTDDTVVVTGRVGTASSSDFVVRSYSTTGGALTQQWTTSFSGAANTSDWGYALTLDAGGRIVAAGSTHAGTVDIDRWLGVFMPDGSALDPPCIDDGTGADGRVPDGDDRIRGLALAPDGRIAATGFATKSVAEMKDAWIALYEPEGCQTVWQKTVFGREDADDEGRAVTVDDDGTIVTVGYLREFNTNDIWIEKRNADGEWLWDDLVNGRSDGNDVATAVAIDENHEVVVAGYVSTVDGSDVWVGRYTP